MGREVTELDTQIGQRIKAKRVALGMSQTALANAIGVTFQQIQKYERGQNRVAGSRLQALASALHWSISDLLGVDEGAGSTPLPDLSRADHQLLAAFHQMPKDAQASLLALAKGIAAAASGLSTSAPAPDTTPPAADA